LTQYADFAIVGDMLDLYTKAILTLIAACLVWLCVQGQTSQAVHAQDVQRVVIAGIDRFKPTATLPVQVVGEVEIGNSAINVNLEGQPIEVKVAPAPRPFR
jgi:hypothetical protein